MTNVYWRRNDGRIERERIKSNNDSLIRALFSASNLFQRDADEATLFASLAFISNDNEELNREDSLGIIRSAKSKWLQKQPESLPTGSQFLDYLRLELKDFRRKPHQNYIVVGGLSISGSVEVPKRVLEVVANLVNRKDFPYPTGELDLTRSFLSFHLKSKYQFIAFNTQVRSQYEALQVGETCIQVLHALLNLQLTYRLWSTMHFEPTNRKTLARVHMSPIWTVHYTAGSALDQFAYTDDYSQDFKCFKMEPKHGSVLQRDVAKLDQSPFKGEMTDLLCTYSIAISGFNLSSTFLALWAILEKCTKTDASKGYEQTIKRALWVFNDDDLAHAKAILNTLRIARNRFVHSHRLDQESFYWLCQRLKHFVDVHLYTLLHNPYKVRSLEEWGQVLSLPRKNNELRDRISWHSKIANIKDPITDFQI